MAADELTKALLVEEVASPRAIAEALFASVNGGVPLLQALVDSGAASPDVLARYIGRSEAPFLRTVMPVAELVDRLPPGLCKRLLALPVRHDAITGTIDVVVADTADPHPANEIGFHLGAPVRVVRAPVAAIEEALRRLRMSSRERFSVAPADRSREAARATPPNHPRRAGLVVEADSAPPPAPRPAQRIRTPPWGTPIHVISEQQRRVRAATEPPRSGYGSEIPIPLTRKTVHPGKLEPSGVAEVLGVRRGSPPTPSKGGTQRPAGLVNPATAGLGEGYAFDPTGLRDVVERPAGPQPPMEGSFIPGPPPLPKPSGFAAYAPQLPFPEMGGILAALRNAGSRDEVLELVLTGARMVALKVALFVVKKGGYLGWVGTSEFADRSSLQSVLIPLDANSVFDRAVREDIYLGPIRYDDVHAPLLRIIKNPSREVAVVPIRVSGKTAVIIMADELGDTMIGTRRLEELARAAGEAFARIVRTRR
ncbi:MAG: FrgA [Labilithrix sp.]|nr:FrgA [Labilithrix sp.]